LAVDSDDGRFSIIPLSLCSDNTKVKQ